MRRILFLICLLGFCHAEAQTESLVDKLKAVSDKSSVSFSYDSDLLQNVTVKESIVELEDLLNYLVQNSALRIEQVSSSEYLLIPQKSTIEFTFRNEGTTSPSFYVDIIRGENEVLYQNFISEADQTIRFNWTPRPYDTIKVISTAHDPVLLAGNSLITNLTQRVSLKEKVTYLEEIVIQNYLTKGINLDVPNQTTSLKTDDLALIPGETDGDVLAALATLPGVNTPDSRPGNLFIRGSSADQNLMLYNNIPIYHRGHYFGTISPYNPAAVSNVTISKNGYNPSLGGRVGGAIEIRSQDDLSAFDTYGVGLNSLYGSVFGKANIKNEVGISVSARHSLPGGILSPKLRQISEMVYSATALTDPQSGLDYDEIDVKYEDYNFNALWKASDKNLIKLSGLYSNNLTSYRLGTDSTSAEETISYHNEGLSLEWNRTFSEGVRGKLITFFSNYFVRYDNENKERMSGQKTLDEGAENRLQDAGLSYELNLDAGSANNVTLGLSSQWTDVAIDYRDAKAESRPVIVTNSDNTFIHSLFGNYKYLGAGKFYFQAGGRLEYNSLTGRPYFSPRMLLNYDLSKSLILKGSVGRYYQFLNQIKYLQYGSAGFDNEMWRLADDKGIRVLHSDQAMIGGIFTKGAFVLDVEAYKKQVEDVNYSSTFRLGSETQFSTADWDIQGIDIFSKVQVADGFSVWGSYEYSEHSLTFDSLTSVSYDYKNNRPHRFKMGGLYQKGPWKFSYSWKILSGLYGRSVDILAELDQIFVRVERQRPPPPPPGGGPPPGDPPMMGPQQRPATIDDLPVRYPTFNSFDLFVTYQLPKRNARSWDAVFGLSLINLLNNENQIDQVVRGPEQRNLVERYALGFTPNLNITITW